MESLSGVKKRLPKIEFHEAPKPKVYDALQMRKIFKNYLEKNLGISNYVVHVDTFNDHTIWVKDSRLCIGKSIRRNENNIKRLIVHEIESHILQRHNIYLSNNPLIRLAKLYEARLFAEGIAVYNEVLTKTITRGSYETYWLRLKAVTMLQYSFREIFDEIAKESTPEKAFMITYRVKRGMGDTASPGGFPKDASYLYGFERVYEYVKNGGNLSFLYLVRVPEVGELLEKYDLIGEYKYKLPSFIKTEKVKDPVL